MEIGNFVGAYLIAFIIMLAIDGVWLFVMSKKFYTPRLSHLMTAKPLLLPAAIFYFMYIFVLIYLVVAPAIQNNLPLPNVFLNAFLLGLASYGTYDLTNNASMKNWPAIVTVVDMIWGASLTGLVALLTVAIL